MRIEEVEAVKRRPNLTVLERLLLKTVDSLASQVAELKPVDKDLEETRHQLDVRQKVLVVVAHDGWTEVYADDWIDVKVIECWPWEDEAELMMPEVYQRLYYPGKLRATALARLRVRPALHDVAVSYARYLDHAELVDSIRTRIAELKRGRGE